MNHRTLFLAASLLFVAGASAANFNYGISLGVGHSDNISRESSDEQGEALASAGLDFGLMQETARLRARAAADLSYVDYLDDTYDSEVVGNLSAQAIFGIVPDRFEWFAADNFGQVRSDPFQAVTPDNSENVNYFTTGPDFTLRFGAATRGRLSARYSKVTYEDSPLDNGRLGGALSLLRNVSSASTLSVNLRSEKIEYDNNSLLANDYDRDEASLQYVLEGSRTRADLELGYNTASRDSMAEDSDGLVARVNVRRQASSASAFTVRLGHELSDASGAFRLQHDLHSVSPGAQTTLQNADLFTNEYASLGWDFQGRRTGFGVAVATFDEAYEQQTQLDRRRDTASLYVYRDLKPHLRGEIRGLFANEEFQNVDTDFRDKSFTASLAWQAASKLSLRLQYDHSRRSSSDVVGESTENRVWLQLRYGLAARQSPMESPGRPAAPAPGQSGM